MTHSAVNFIAMERHEWLEQHEWTQIFKEQFLQSDKSNFIASVALGVNAQALLYFSDKHSRSVGQQMYPTYLYVLNRQTVPTNLKVVKEGGKES